FIIDTQRLWHVVHNPGPQPRYALITSWESGDSLQAWIDAQSVVGQRAAARLPHGSRRRVVDWEHLAARRAGLRRRVIAPLATGRALLAVHRASSWNSHSALEPWPVAADTPRPFRSGPALAQARQHGVVEQPVAGHHVAAAAVVDAGEVAEPATGFADDEAGGAYVPLVDDRLDAATDGALGDEHVRPEAPEAAHRGAPRRQAGEPRPPAVAV